MIANISIVVVWLVAQSYGRLSRFFFQSDHLEHDDIQRHFFTPGFNLAKLMSDMSAVAEQCFTARPIVAICRLIVCLWLFFLVAALIYSLKYSGLELLFQFISRGLTVDIDQNEKDFLLQHAPAAYYALSRDSGNQIFIGDYLRSFLIIISMILAFLSLVSALSIQNTLALVRRLKNNKNNVAAVVRMAITFFVGLLLDLAFVILFFLTIILSGKAIGLTLEEEFNASIDGHWLAHGVTLVSGRATKTPTSFSFEYGARDVNFDELTHVSTPPPAWLRWILPTTMLRNDALVLCNRPGAAPRCEDRLRALFRQRNTTVDKSGMYSGALRVIFEPARAIACGNNSWRMPMGRGASEVVRFILPLLAALIIVYLVKVLLIPTLIVIAISNFALVRLGAYAAISSETGLSMTTTHGAALLTAPPIVAFALLTAFARWSCY